MATPLKFILIIFLAACIATNVSGQKTDTTDSYQRLQAFRQIFWDSLPQPSGRVNDYEHLFTEVEKKQLDSITGAFKNKTDAEICIVTLDTLYTSKEQFDELALHIANVWGVGQKDKNNGVTICISKGHRKIRICNGYGIEPHLSDNETKEIVDQDFIPSFKNDLYYKGTVNGLMAIIAKLSVTTK